MRYLVLPFLLIYSLTALGQEKDSKSLFDDFNAFFVNEVVFGLVDYGALKENPETLNNLVTQIANYSLEGVSQDHRAAFYINTYNTLVIKQIVDNYPIKSPMDVKGFFKITTFEVANEIVTLDQIEFIKLFAATNDPRIHFALGCGARSCPYLYGNAFYPEKLQEQLEFRAQLIIDRPNYVHVLDDEKKVVLNKIFDWYSDQFIENAGSLLSYVNKYRFYKVPDRYEVEFQEYDWSLNDR